MVLESSKDQFVLPKKFKELVNVIVDESIDSGEMGTFCSAKSKKFT